MSNRDNVGGSGVRAPHLVHLRVKPPQPLSVRGGPKDQEDWKLWQQEWTNCAKNTKLEQHTPDVQTSLFHHCAGRSVLKIFSALEFGHNESNVDLQTSIQKLEAYFVGETNETFERWHFNKRDQQLHENIDGYVTCLWNLAKTCNINV